MAKAPTQAAGGAEGAERAAWAHALAAPIAALEVLVDGVRTLPAPQQALLEATLGRLKALQRAALAGHGPEPAGGPSET